MNTDIYFIGSLDTFEYYKFGREQINYSCQSKAKDKITEVFIRLILVGNSTYLQVYCIRKVCTSELYEGIYADVMDISNPIGDEYTGALCSDICGTF